MPACTLWLGVAISGGAMGEIIFEWSGGWVEVQGGWPTVAAVLASLFALAFLIVWICWPFRGRD
jgi:hypothetical protein